MFTHAWFGAGRTDRLKPENVLLGYDAAVVADFGVAKAISAARTQDASPLGTTLTRGGVALGTPAYMSPEQAAGDPAVDHRADIYAWGIVAYELLSGAHPFAGRQSVQALVTAHLVEPPRSLDEVAPSVPPAVRALVMRCLAKNASDRPGSAREIIETLATTVDGEHGHQGESRDVDAGRAPAPPGRAPSTAWRPRPLATFLVAGLSATDPLSLAGTAAAFALVSVLASWIPARRAMRVSPALAMRLE